VPARLNAERRDTVGEALGLRAIHRADLHFLQRGEQRSAPLIGQLVERGLLLAADLLDR
jgi:hypothetical protein